MVFLLPLYCENVYGIIILSLSVMSLSFRLIKWSAILFRTLKLDRKKQHIYGKIDCKIQMDIQHEFNDRKKKKKLQTS